MNVLWCYGIICIYGIFPDLRFKISGFADVKSEKEKGRTQGGVENEINEMSGVCMRSSAVTA
jgi:hypothetical protein